MSLKKKHMTHLFLFSHPYLGEDSHFDEHIFEMGWFNHQPDDGSLGGDFKDLQNMWMFPKNRGTPQIIHFNI